MKPDYNFLLDRCKYVSNTSGALIDDFLVYYSANRDKTDIEFESRISRFKEIVKEMPPNWKGLIKTQYIAHRIFKTQGLIHRYLKGAAVKERTDNEQELLHSMASHPWRFCFSEIINDPAPDFYEMEDIFTGDTFLLYSPAVTRTLAEQPALLWFNLISYNNFCWQTFGPVTAYQSFDIDDIFFYATELDPALESDEDIIASIEDNPVRYMVLACGAQYPLIVQGGHEVVQLYGDTSIAAFDIQTLRKSFNIEYAKGVFKASHEVWSAPPHFAEAYYEEASHTITLSALTGKGFLEFAKLLNKYGIKVDPEPEIRLHVSMTAVIKKALKRPANLIQHNELFAIQESPESKAEMAKLNHLLRLALPYINAGKEPDVIALARESGIDPQIAATVLQQATGRIDHLKKQRD